jgi:hypothetical protein
MDARVRTKSPTRGASRAAFSHRVVGTEPAPGATANSLARQQCLPRLTAYHRRCLGKRVSECHGDLAQAVCALGEAQRWAPWDPRLEAACVLLTVAHSFTDLAWRLCGEASVAIHPKPGPGLNDHLSSKT